MHKNVGTFDAGVYSPFGAGGVAFAAGAISVTDAAVASGNAFLVSELERLDPEVRKPLSSVTWYRDIPVRTGGGWVDATSKLGISYGLSNGSGESPVAAGGANNIPIMQASYDKALYKAHSFAVAMRIPYIDLQKARYSGRGLEVDLADGIRRAYDEHMDENVYVGFERFGTTGLINSTEATETTAATGAGRSTTWATKTPEEILADINAAITAAWTAAGHDNDAVPNHILLPYAQYQYIISTMVTALAGKSIYDYVMENNVAVKTGGSLFIGGCKWCAGAGTGGADRMAVYVNKKRFAMVEELVPLTRAMSLPNATQFSYDTTYAANISEAELPYPQTIHYVDGI